MDCREEVDVGNKDQIKTIDRKTRWFHSNNNKRRHFQSIFNMKSKRRREQEGCPRYIKFKVNNYAGQRE